MCIERNELRGPDFQPAAKVRHLRSDSITVRWKTRGKLAFAIYDEHGGCWNWILCGNRDRFVAVRQPTFANRR